MRARRLVGGLVVIAAMLAAVAYVWRAQLGSALPTGARTAAVNPTTQVINRGEYLARAGDCVACHTLPNGKAFAGGRPMPTPFGALYAPNITPDEETGIGAGTADEFYRMMHTGISRDGSLMYPAM